MSYRLKAIVIGLVISVFIACRSGRSAISLVGLVGKEKLKLQENISTARNHIDVFNIVDSAAVVINGSSQVVQKEIAAILDGDALRAYFEERASFLRWQEFQDTVANDAVSVIGELYVGGTGVGELVAGHLYRVAAANYADQTVLLGLLRKDSKVESTVFPIAIEQIDRAKESLYDDLELTSSFREDPEVTQNVERVRTVLDSDYALFTDWMSKRAALQTALPENCRADYSASTSYWMQVYCEFFLGKIISNTY